MTVAELTDDQKEEIYQLFFCGRESISQWSDGSGKVRYNNSIKTIAEKTRITPFVVNVFLDKCIAMRRELSKPIGCEISRDQKTMTLTYKSRINYEI